MNKKFNFIHLEYICKECGGTWEYLSMIEDYKCPIKECFACKSKNIKYKIEKVYLNTKKPGSNNGQ